MAVNRDRSAGDIVESEQKFQARRLARTGLANNGRLGAGLHGKTDTIDGWLLALVGKANIIESDFTLRVFESYRIGLFDNTRRFLELQDVSFRLFS